MVVVVSLIVGEMVEAVSILKVLMVAVSPPVRKMMVVVFKKLVAVFSLIVGKLLEIALLL